MRSRPLLALLLAVLSVAVLAACGGGSSTSTTTSPASDPSPSPSPAPPTQKPTQAAQEQANAERRIAGRAAPFVAPESDNSVPTFGKEAGAGERSEAEANLSAYLRARSAEDWASACDQLAKSVREGYEKLGSSSSKAKAPGCPEVLAALSNEVDLSDPLTGHLLSLRVHGDNAFALFYGPGHQQYMVPMNLEGGQWRPTQAAPIPYPPGTSR
jgi:hypothetical protein